MIRLLSLVVAVLGAAMIPLPAAQTPPRVFQYENVLGTSLEIKLAASTEAAADRARSAVLAEIDRVARIISTYDAESDYSRWFKTEQEPVEVPGELLEVFALYDRWQGLSDGALNAGTQVLSQLWEKAARDQKLPGRDELDAAIAAARSAHWKLDPARGTATHLGRAPLSLDAAGKGYIIGRACDAALGVRGVSGIVVNIGGDLAVRGNLSEPVEIADPRDDAENAAPIARITVRELAVATSGNYRRSLEIAGRRYSHVIDPRTGQPAGQIISSTVVAPDAGDADALVTIASVLTPEESIRLADELPGTACLLIARDGTRFVSRRWSALENPKRFAAAGDYQFVANESTPEATPAPASAEWDPSYELIVNLEIAKILEGRARRPFVAVWIEDSDGFPVRTLALWFKGARWLPDLRSWYRGDQLRALAENTDLKPSVSSATRSAGKYTLKWNGQDNDGKLVKAGRYTVLIEAAREHGTHQLIKQEIDFSGMPRHFDLPANAEIAGGSLDYRRISDEK